MNAYITDLNGNKVRNAQTMTLKANQCSPVLANLSRDTLRNMARENGLRTGKDKQDTISALTKAQVKLTVAVVMD